MTLKKALYPFAIWLVPVLLVILESALFLSKANWASEYVPYFVTFWVLRALLAPLIVYYTLKFWVDHKKWLRLFLVHIGGFLLFSLVFWTTATFFLNDILNESKLFGVETTSTSLGIFGMIVDNSISTNIIVYVSTVAFCYLWEFMNQNILINKKAMELEKSLLTSRLELLKGQLNTHFLFNTLNTISSFVVRQRNDEANKMLVNLGELLRFALRDNKDQLIPLYKELELLQLYLDIQQTRFRDRLELSVNVDSRVKNNMVPSLILQPLVENAVKYAVEPYKEKGLIQIDIKASNGTLFILVKDNGRKPFNEIDFNNGVGLGNTKERLKQLYNENFKFQVSPNREGPGITVAIGIPNQSKEDVEVKNSDSR